jgi:hypothetical protein
MSLSRIPIMLALLAVALVAVPAAMAKARDHRAIRIQGTCTQQSTSKLKLSREDGRIEVEFEVDQNQAGVPWTVTVNRNNKTITSFTATTRAPSGSFEARRLISGKLGSDRIKAVATRSGESCTADSSQPKPTPTTTAPAAGYYGTGHESGEDHGSQSSDDSGHHTGGHA